MFRASGFEERVGVAWYYPNSRFNHKVLIRLVIMINPGCFILEYPVKTVVGFLFAPCQSSKCYYMSLEPRRRSSGESSTFFLAAADSEILQIVQKDSSLMSQCFVCILFVWKDSCVMYQHIVHLFS